MNRQIITREEMELALEECDRHSRDQVWYQMTLLLKTRGIDVEDRYEPTTAAEKMWRTQFHVVEWFKTGKPGWLIELPALPATDEKGTLGVWFVYHTDLPAEWRDEVHEGYRGHVKANIGAIFPDTIRFEDWERTHAGSEQRPEEGVGTRSGGEGE